MHKATIKNHYNAFAGGIQTHQAKGKSMKAPDAPL